PPDDPAAWQRQAETWELFRPMVWAVSSVHPARCERLVQWLQEQGHTAHLVIAAAQLPLRVCVERPDWVGIDRLLNAVAANRRRRAGEAQPAVLIDAGSAVTVDWLDETGAFQGGTI